MKTVTQHPWQNGPTELIRYAIEHLHKEMEFDQRISFLLLDIGVETLFKTFLTLPEDVTGAKIKFPDRKRAAEGSFHDLVKGMEAAAPSKLKEFNLAHIQFYHDLRNKLYHQGNGITIPTEKAKGYAELAVRLLEVLLDVNLTHLLREPETKARLQEKQEKLEQELNQQIITIHKELDHLRVEVRLAIERIEPRLLLPSFEKQLSACYEFEGHKRDKIFMKAIDAVVSEQALKDYLLPEGIQRLLIESWSIDVTFLYFHIISRDLPEAMDWERHYALAKMFPDYAQQPVIKEIDEDGPLTEIIPTTSEVIEEGKRLLSQLRKIGERIQHWVSEGH